MHLSREWKTHHQFFELRKRPTKSIDCAVIALSISFYLWQGNHRIIYYSIDMKMLLTKETIRNVSTVDATSKDETFYSMVWN